MLPAYSLSYFLYEPSATFIPLRILLL